jgi:hypothetical protein
VKSNLLFPPFFRIIGLILALAGLALGYIFIFRNLVISFLDYRSGNFTDEVATTLVVSGLIFIGFSRVKNENGQTILVRLNALYWAVLAEGLFLTVYWIIQFLVYKLKIPVTWHALNLVKYNLFNLLLIFIARLYYTLNKLKKGKKHKSIYFLPNIPFSLIAKIASMFFFILIIADWAFPSINALFKLLPDDTIVLFPFCLLIWIWSKEKNEIGVVKNIRLKAMQIAVYINYSLFLIATWIFFGIDYLLVLMIGLASIQIIFIIVFYYQQYTLRKKHTKIAVN